MMRVVTEVTTELSNLEQLKQVLQLKIDIVKHNPAAALIGADIITGLTDSTVVAILNCSEIDSVQKIQQLGVTSPEFAFKVYDIIKQNKQVRCYNLS